MGKARVAQNEEILEKLTSLSGLGFILGPIVQYKFFLDFVNFYGSLRHPLMFYCRDP